MIFRQMTSALFLALDPVLDMLCLCLHNTQQLVQDVSALSDSPLGVDYVPSLVQCLRTYCSLAEGHCIHIGYTMQF